MASTGEPGPTRDLRFSIHFGGCKPGWQHQRSDLFASPLSLPAFIGAGMVDQTALPELSDKGAGMTSLVHPRVCNVFTHDSCHFRPFTEERVQADEEAVRACIPFTHPFALCAFALV